MNQKKHVRVFCVCVPVASQRKKREVGPTRSRPAVRAHAHTCVPGHALRRGTPQNRHVDIYSIRKTSRICEMERERERELHRPQPRLETAQHAPQLLRPEMLCVCGCRMLLRNQSEGTNERPVGRVWVSHATTQPEREHRLLRPVGCGVWMSHATTQPERGH